MTIIITEKNIYNDKYNYRNYRIVRQIRDCIKTNCHVYRHDFYLTVLYSAKFSFSVYEVQVSAFVLMCKKCLGRSVSHTFFWLVIVMNPGRLKPSNN